MNVLKAKWTTDSDGTWICFKAAYPSEARQVVRDFDESKKYSVELKENKRKRSLDANAMAWTLMNKLSAYLGVPDREIYREYVKDIGNNSFITPVAEKHIKHWDDVWQAGHYGRFTEDLGECRHHKGYHNIRSYIGSSDYDTKQMARLIDMIFEDCKYNGIDVMTDAERDLLLERWDRHTKE